MIALVHYYGCFYCATTTIDEDKVFYRPNEENLLSNWAADGLCWLDGDLKPPLSAPSVDVGDGPPSVDSVVVGIVNTVSVLSYSDFRDMMVVISLTVIRLTSTPSMATIRSP